ncbi:MAG: hypothetical protein [Bacteriophage sp.]|nr:MAG: hypothetical protein [Bacteriophage sp.]
MTEYKVPTERELDIIAEDYVCSLNDDELPVKEEDLTEECLREILNDEGYELVKEQMNDFINYILSSSDSACRQIRDKAISEFKESLDGAISNASEVLSDEDKLKIVIEVASSFCYV